MLKVTSLIPRTALPSPLPQGLVVELEREDDSPLSPEANVKGLAVYMRYTAPDTEPSFKVSLTHQVFGETIQRQVMLPYTYMSEAVPAIDFALGSRDDLWGFSWLVQDVLKATIKFHFDNPEALVFDELALVVAAEVPPPKNILPDFSYPVNPPPQSFVYQENMIAWPLFQATKAVEWEGPDVDAVAYAPYIAWNVSAEQGMFRLNIIPKAGWSVESASNLAIEEANTDITPLVTQDDVSWIILWGAVSSDEVRLSGQVNLVHPTLGEGTLRFTNRMVMVRKPAA